MLLNPVFCTVLVPPRIIIQESTETLRPRDLFRVTCEAFDPLTNEHLRVEWSRDHAELPSSATVVDGTLEIVSVTSADAGLYRCTASNEAGVHSAVTELVIFGHLHVFVLFLIKLIVYGICWQFSLVQGFM